LPITVRYVELHYVTLRLLSLRSSGRLWWSLEGRNRLTAALVSLSDQSVQTNHSSLVSIQYPHPPPVTGPWTGALLRIQLGYKVSNL